jgi:hypothetical protein
MKDKIDSRDSLIVLLKDKYDHEYGRKKYFDDALGVPITLSSFLVGGIYYVINDSSNIQDLTIRTIFEVLVALLFIICIVTFYFLYKVYFTYNSLYSSFPDSKEVSDYYNNFKKHQVECGKKEGSLELEECISSDLKDQTITWYIKANTKNLDQNEKRGQNFINAKLFLGLALVFGVLIFSLTCINKSVNMAKQPTQQNPKPTPPTIRRDKASKPNAAPSTTKK